MEDCHGDSYGHRVPTERFAGEKTIAGWIMSLAVLDKPPQELPDHLRH